jgi:quercetin dioxygenase-like cupin family protein
LKASGPKFGAAEIVISPGEEPPLHIHKNEDEWFYMLDGEVSFHVGHETFRGQPGSFVLFPRGIAHTFTVESNSARFLLMITPGGFERMFEANPQTPEDAGKAMMALECEIVGPHPRMAKAA